MQRFGNASSIIGVGRASSELSSSHLCRACTWETRDKDVDAWGGGDVGHMSCCGPLLYLGMTCRCVHVRCLFGTVLGERVMACRREFQVASRFRPRDIGADPLLCEGVGIPL